MQIEANQRKQDSLVSQYQKLIDGMKQEMRELQRNAELSEMRFLQTK